MEQPKICDPYDGTTVIPYTDRVTDAFNPGSIAEYGYCRNCETNLNHQLMYAKMSYDFFTANARMADAEMQRLRDLIAACSKKRKVWPIFLGGLLIGAAILGVAWLLHYLGVY